MSNGYVYFLSDGHDLVKIGMAVDPHRRVKEIGQSHPRFVILHAIETNNMWVLERRMHARFKRWHQGGEWYGPLEDKGFQAALRRTMWVTREEIGRWKCRRCGDVNHSTVDHKNWDNGFGAPAGWSA